MSILLGYTYMQYISYLVLFYFGLYLLYSLCLLNVTVNLEDIKEKRKKERKKSDITPGI